MYWSVVCCGVCFSFSSVLFMLAKDELNSAILYPSCGQWMDFASVRDGYVVTTLSQKNPKHLHGLNGSLGGQRGQK